MLGKDRKFSSAELSRFVGNLGPYSLSESSAEPKVRSITTLETGVGGLVPRDPLKLGIFLRLMHKIAIKLKN